MSTQHTKKLLFYFLAVLLAGCVPVMSLYPLYTEKDVVFEEKLLGSWLQDNDESTWEFSRTDEPKNAYKLIFADNEDRKGSFVAHLVKLQDRLFLDVYPSELPWEPEDPNKADWLYNSLFLIPAHTFIKVESIEPQLRMRLTIESELKELLEENPDAVRHTTIEDRLVLTASTKEVQAFVLKYADNDRLFGVETVLNRKKLAGPNVPKRIEPAASRKGEPKRISGRSLQDIIRSRKTWNVAFPSWIGRRTPDFTVRDIKGARHRLSDYRGRDLMVVFWATWHPPCIMEIPHLIELRNTFRESELAILAISNEPPERLKQFVAAKRINYVVASQAGSVLPAPFANVVSIPTTFFIDRRGTVKLASEGLVSIEDTKEILQAR